MTFVKEKKKKIKQAPPAPLTEEQRLIKQQLKRMKKRCAILSIEKLGERNFRVWGGEEPHIVSIVMGQPQCDCIGWRTALNGNCSHITKWRLTHGDLKK